MTLFADIWAGVEPALDAVRGEGIKIVPRVSKYRGSSLPDPDRAERTTVGRFRARPSMGELEGAREGSRYQSMTRIAGSGVSVRISTENAAALGYEIKPGDVVVLIEREGSPSYSVSQVEQDDLRHLRIVLAPESIPAVTP